MEPDPQPQVNAPAVLINSEGLYVIIAVLGVSILGCACVLTYSFSNYSKLKKNAEEVRNFIASRSKVNEITPNNKESRRRQAAAEPVKVPAPVPSASVVNLLPPTASNRTYALAERQQEAESVELPSQANSTESSTATAAT